MLKYNLYEIFLLSWCGILGLLTIFLLQVVSTATNTLKTIFLTKGITKPAYLMTFIDAIVFVLSMKLALDGEGFIFLIVYAIGKTLGAILGDIVEKKLAIGTLEITISIKKNKAIEIADNLRELGYTVNTREVYGLHGNERYEVWFIIKRKEYNFIIDYLNKLGHDNLSMVVAEVKNVTGKIKTTKSLEI